MNITSEQMTKAIGIAKKFKVKAVFINNKGEFFTEETYAKNSVGGKEENYAKIDKFSKKEANADKQTPNS